MSVLSSASSAAVRTDLKIPAFQLPAIDDRSFSTAEKPKGCCTARNFDSGGSESKLPYYESSQRCTTGGIRLPTAMLSRAKYLKKARTPRCIIQSARIHYLVPVVEGT
jgi:hypothetical protein